MNQEENRMSKTNKFWCLNSRIINSNDNVQLIISDVIVFDNTINENVIRTGKGKCKKIFLGGIFENIS